MISLVEDGSISGTIAKTVFEEMFSTGKPPRQVVEERGLTLISSADELTAVVEGVIAANEKAVADYNSGKQEALKFLIGQTMRQTKGRASPGLVQELLESRLNAT
jgi:aspartyl-tRNA(Asn)/glutamyl-tRNA(Gln) amidotransferase subunit B